LGSFICAVALNDVIAKAAAANEASNVLFIIVSPFQILLLSLRSRPCFRALTTIYVATRRVDWALL
jgi:hypothetical protein